MASLFVTVLLAVVASTQAWDFMLFEQQWAPGVCEGGSNGDFSLGSQQFGKHHGGGDKTCKIPSGTTSGFTIHGSWPTKIGTEGPNYCNDTWQFSVDPIKDLVPDMDVYWPSLYGPNMEFWSHEWDKHGVCAASVFALNSEHKFFSFVLKMREQHDFAKYLASGNVVPNAEQGYSVRNMTESIKHSLGATPLLICKNANGAQYLISAGMCISPGLDIIECDPSVFSQTGNECDTSTPVIFLPQHTAK